MRKMLSVVCVLVLAASAFAMEYADVSPNLGPISPQYEPDVMWDVVQSFNCQQTYSQLQLGSAFAGGYFWVCGGGMSSAVTTDNKYYRFTPAGTLVDSFSQPTNSGWGWRDLAFDGTYLYAGCEVAQVVAFNPANGALVPTMNFPKPAAAAVVRALAYDPATDHFWTGNFGSNIIEFDRSGNVIWQGSPTPLTAVYGMAWDPNYSAGPTMWVFDQGGAGCVFYRFNPVTHTMTTESHTVPLLPGLTSQIAGGAEMSSTYNAGYKAMIGLAQGTPVDMTFALQMETQGAPPDLNITLTPVGTIVIPAPGGNFNYNAALVNNGPAQVPYVAWTRDKFPNGTYTSPLLGPVTLNTPVGVTITRQRTQTIPGTYPAGVHTYLGYLNTSFSYPAIDSSSFTWTKSADDDGSPWVYNAENYGEPFPGEVMPVPRTQAVLNNFPNPFNPSTTISFSLPEAQKVTLNVYDMSGRLVTTLVNGVREAGVQQVTFDGSNLSSGIYMYTLTAGGHTTSAKMVLMK